MTKRHKTHVWMTHPHYLPTDNNHMILGKDSFNQMFSVLRENNQFDIYSKRVALRAAPSLVCLKIFSGNEEIRWGSGFVLECLTGGDNRHVYIIITSTSLFKRDHTSNLLLDDLKIVVVLADGSQSHGDLQAHDFHYNLAAVKIDVDHAIEVAKMRSIDDLIPITIPPSQEQSFDLQPDRDLYRLVPGSPLLALGRFHDDGRLMIAPGLFSIEQCRFDCKDLLRSTCLITKCGIGGPVVNRNAEVVGVNFHDLRFTPFLPSNIVSKWWKHFQKFNWGSKFGFIVLPPKGDMVIKHLKILASNAMEYRRPWLGLELSNLYTIDVRSWERIIQRFPFVKEGIVVDEVTPNSPASSAEVLPDDIIVEFDGEAVKSCLQFFDLIWDKVGKAVKLVVIRRMDNSRTEVSVTVANICDNDEFNRWPIIGGG